MNKKGFAISSIVYAILILFLALIAGILGLLGNRKLMLDKTKNDVMNKLNNSQSVTTVYKDNSGASIPELYSNMIPVMYQNGNWVYADVYSKWYDYDLKEWANAVVLNTGVTKNIGDVISESEIALWYVWVPRYKYKIFDTGLYTSSTTVTTAPTISGAKTIEIVFEGKNATKSNGTNVNNYLTHPAFTFGDKELNGIWVGKFESSNKEGSSTNNSSLTLTIKPNVSSWRNINVYNAFQATRTAEVTYSLGGDSHMMKNTEWGAVAYLAHSKYGIKKEIRINNSSTFITGCAATTAATSLVTNVQTDGSEGYFEGCENAYNTTTGVLASTTGNITGIYDMSGGTWEYLAAYIDGVYGSSGFTSISDSDKKYFDVYPSGSILTSYDKRILGDATGELGPFYYYQDSDGINRYHSTWYADNSVFVNSSSPWFGRGGDYSFGVLSGSFYFGIDTGSAGTHSTFRAVLVEK